MKKPLILIIANDNPPVYLEMQSLWRQWIDKHSVHCYCYFLKMKNDMKETIEIDETEHTIYVRGNECLVPGILQKTMIAMEYCIQRFPEVSTIIRTNLSSVILLDKINDELSDNVARGYTGQHFDYSLNRYIHFISGAFICLSKDIWIKTLNQYLNDIRENPMDGIWCRLPDDVCIGEYLGLSEVLILHLENRYWVNHQLTKEDVEEIKNTPGICHIRCESYRHERTVDSMMSFL